jgi:uncharacterized membrane protein
MIPVDPQGDEGLARVVSILLRAGVLLAALIAAVGGYVFLHGSASSVPDFAVFRGAPASVSTIARTVAAARGGDGEALIQVGILALIATPVVRVIVSLLGFARERDWAFVVLTAIVLVALASSLVQAR